MKLARSGDSDGMRTFYERYAGYLTAVCSRYVVDRADVKDILQEAFVKIFQKLGQFEYRSRQRKGLGVKNRGERFPDLPQVFIPTFIRGRSA